MEDLINKFPKSYNHIRVEYKGDVAYLTFDYAGEKINKLSSFVLRELDDALDILAQRNGLKLLVLLSAKAKNGIFIAGADIKEIENIKTKEEAMQVVSEGQRIVTRLKKVSFKSLAVIDGACMGGGTELALACTFRIASDSPKTRIGLPEVNLGIMPGFGGTQTMPALIGLPAALDLILSGRALDGKKACKMGLVDDCFPFEYAEVVTSKWVKKILEGDTRDVFARRKKPFIEKIPFIGKEMIFREAKKNVLKQTKGRYPAPLAALQTIKETYGSPLDYGLKIELEKFVDLVVSDISKNLIQIFYTSEELKKEYADVASAEISDVFVLGAGVMGGGIAWLFSNNNIGVRMKDISLKGIEIGFKQIGEIYSGLIKKRRLKPAQVAQKMMQITSATTNSGLEKADLVVEAIIEDLAIKQKTLAEVEALARKDAIIATNTSSLLLKDISANLVRKENFVGMHFFNPVNKMPLVEVVKAADTGDKAVATIVSLSRKMGKTPIVVGDCAGFVVNRLLLSMMNEALFCLEDVGDVVRIDKIFTDFGLPMGPFLLADEVGLDVAYKVCKNLQAAYGERMHSSEILGKVYNDHKLLGKKAGLGFYKHDGREFTLNTELAAELQNSSKKARISDEEILERCMFIMINEASRILEEKMVKNAKQLDMAMIMGTGFPPFRGGLLRYADSVGVAKIVARLEEFAVKYGAKFAPSFSLQSMVKDNFKFY